MTPPSTHDRTEAQAVEIVLALFVSVLVCVAVVIFSWLLRLVVGTVGGPVWGVATGVVAIGFGLGALARQMVQARRGGL